jgi:selenide,water dikinase
VEIESGKVPILESASELASMGMIPAGSFANKHFCQSLVDIDPRTDQITADLLFDAQTSGGLVLGVPAEMESQVRNFLHNLGEMAETIGRVSERSGNKVIRINA